MSINWTLKDLANLEAAMALGVREVEYNDRRVKYNTFKEMKEAREMIRRSLGQTKSGARLLCESSKGTC